MSLAKRRRTEEDCPAEGPGEGLDGADGARPTPFQRISRCQWRTARPNLSQYSEVCSCNIDEALADEAQACGASCTNRGLQVECDGQCPCRHLCRNKRIQKGPRKTVEVFRAGRKGFGIRTTEPLSP